MQKPHDNCVADPNPNDSWHRWIAECGDAFLLYARQRARSEEDARDLVQDAVTESWQRSHGNVPDKALVFATIRRRAIDLARATDSRARRETQSALAHPSWFEPDFTASDTRDTIAAALRDLPDDQREVVSLRLWGGLSFPEIAAVTGVPAPTAASRYRAAIERLRLALSPIFA